MRRPRVEAIGAGHRGGLCTDAGRRSMQQSEDEAVMCYQPFALLFPSIKVLRCTVFTKQRAPPLPALPCSGMLHNLMRQRQQQGRRRHRGAAGTRPTRQCSRRHSRRSGPCCCRCWWGPTCCGWCMWGCATTGTSCGGSAGGTLACGCLERCAGAWQTGEPFSKLKRQRPISFAPQLKRTQWRRYVQIRA